MANALHFSEAPSQQEVTRSYPILRCDAEQKFRLSGFILSDRIYGVDVHFVGKSVPCQKHRGVCQWCSLGRPTRWVGYAPAVDHNRQKLFIMELTPGVMPSVVAYQEQYGSLRGCMIHLSRRKARATARLDINVLPVGDSYAPADLPAPFDIESALYKIFGLEADGTDPSHPKPSEGRAATSKEKKLGSIDSEKDKAGRLERDRILAESFDDDDLDDDN